MSKMKQEFGINSKDILVGIGPGIDACHFEVKEDFQEKLADFPQFFTEKEGKTFFDLKKLAEFLLLKQGVLKQNIKISRDCVFCLGDKYFSFRRDEKKESEIRAMMAVIGVKNSSGG
jgi:copper oxidase (laccase) domain-containing protein